MTSVALVHEWLSSMAGSEQTYLRMAEVLPQADLYALTAEAAVDLGDRPVRTTFLQRSSFLRAHRGVSLAMMPVAWKALPAPRYDLVVSSTHAFARLFPSGDAVHLSYVYAPMRYAWTPEIDARGAHPALAPLRAACRRVDRRSTHRVRAFAGISTAVVRRIERFYGRDASVVFPPVDLDRFAPPPPGASRDGFLLGVSRWIPYKRLDLVIRLGERLGMPVVIAGRGPARDELAAVAASASVPVRLWESPSNEELERLYQTCELLVFPAEEDFGIVPVEAQACGTKVVALGRGGSLDTVRDGVTGTLAADQSIDELERAARDCLALGDVADDCRAHALTFSTDAFRRNFAAWVRAEAPDVAVAP